MGCVGVNVKGIVLLLQGYGRALKSGCDGPCCRDLVGPACRGVGEYCVWGRGDGLWVSRVCRIVVWLYFFDDFLPININVC